MKRNINRFLLAGLICCGISATMMSCKNGDQSFSDYEGGTSVYFAYQYPVRTIVLGDDEYDTSLDKAHKCKILATFGGSYNGTDGQVTVAVDPTLVNNLTFADGSPVKAMPDNYYTLATTNFAFGGTMNGGTEVQLTDAFFNDPEAVKNTYVIPLVMTGQTGFGRILSGTLKEGGQPVRTDASQWDVLPMDYVLYCVKYQNKYAGYWLTNGTTSTANIEKAATRQIVTKSLSQAVYKASVGDRSIDLLLTFDGSDHCTITSATDGVTATGSGQWTDDGEKNSWNNKDRDLLELNYTVNGTTVNEKLVWQRSGVTEEEFSPVYTK